MASRARACDRCAELKAQCSGGDTNNPCARCQRLNFLCTADRPLRSRGRPPKATPSATARTRATNPDATAGPTAPRDSESTPGLQLQLQLQHQLPEDFPVDAVVATALLHRICCILHRVGILSAFRREHNGLGPTLLTGRAVWCTLLACAVLFESDDQGLGLDAVPTLAEDCRMHALSDIPILTWKSRAVHRGDIYCLYILANLGYLDQETTEIADRWATLASALACSIHTAHHVQSDPRASELAETDRRIASLLSLNAQVQRLLYNRPYVTPADGDLNPSAEQSAQHPLIQDEEWHRLGEDTMPNVDPPPGCGEGFFDLTLPLLKPLKIALSLPAYHDVAYRAATDCLEGYFLAFPTRLMELTCVDLTWQFEAMLWFHAIYALLHTGADFLELLLDPTFFMSPAMAGATDHAILLGDVLKVMGTKTYVFAEVCHATIFFIALSATIHATVLRHMLLQRLHIPAVLRESSNMHQMALQLILDSNRTCNHSLVHITRNLLAHLNQNFDHTVSPYADSALGETFRELSMYRWIPDGRGLIQLDSITASRLSHITMEKYVNTQGVTSIPSDILAILNPGSRINESNTFDLSILF